MSFRLLTVFYVFALIASALAAFGPGGILPAAIVLGFWAVVFYVPKPRLTIVNVTLFVLVGLLLAALLLPAVPLAREAARRNQCMNQLKQLALAIYNYESAHKELPPARTIGQDGTPLYSWRLSLATYVELYALHARVDKSKRWDDPANLPLLSTPQDLFQCPSDSSTGPSTSYFAIVDERTAWPGAVGRKMSEIKDDPAQTILIVEHHQRSANWAEPRDLTFDGAVELLTSPAIGNGHRVENGFFYKSSTGINVAFADAHVEFLRLPLPRDLAIALLTVDGGEGITPAMLQTAAGPELDYAKCYIFAVFVLLALLPAAWLPRRKAPAAPATESGPL
jgi:prepilin-type processing-associated H-X9-DG protein